MAHTHTARTFTLDDADAAAACYHEEGYAVIKGVFTPEEIVRFKDATDRAKRRGYDMGCSFRHANVTYWVSEDPNIGLNVSGMQWPSHDEPALEAMRRDPRMLRILAPLIGTDIRQIINQIHWKTPGCAFAVNFHRDRINRRPAEAFRDLANSYVQTGTAIDPMTPENGALLVVPGSHRRAPAEHPAGSSFSGSDARRDYLEREGYSEDDLLPIYADPGDIAMWHVDTIHGSDQNRSATMDRCLYINGYVKARNCMRGQWAFIRGHGVPLPPVDVPVLIQRDDIFDHLELERAAGPLKPYD